MDTGIKILIIRLTAPNADGSPAKAGFYNQRRKDAVLLEDVTAWIDEYVEIDEAMKKPGF